MDVAALRSRVVFQKNEATVDEHGNHFNEWVDYYECYATIGGEGLASSREEQVAGTTVQDHSMTVTVRYCRKAAVMSSTGYRILLGGEIYNIVSIDHLGYKKQALKFICRKERR